MAEGIPVSYQENEWLKYLFRFLGVLMLTGGIALPVFVPGSRMPAFLVATLGVVLLAANELVVARQKAAARSVIDTGSGFAWLGGPADVEVHDSQVVAVRIKHVPKFHDGRCKGTVRIFDVWTAGGDPPMCMTNWIDPDATDPLAALIARITKDLKERTAAALADGATLEGGGWRLAAAELSIARGRTVDVLSFPQIDKVATFGGKICIWRRGEDAAAVKISPESKNAPVLAALLDEWVEHQRSLAGSSPLATPGKSGLGRLLFERQKNAGYRMGVKVACGCAALATCVLFVNPDDLCFPLFLLAVAAAALWLGIAFGRCVVRFYELGLTSTQGRDVCRLPYGDITEVTYVATAMHYKGAYIGTRLLLSFRGQPTTSTWCPVIHYLARIQNTDADLEMIRDQVATRIADRMLENLRAGKVVPWMPDVDFLPEGLRFRRAKMLGMALGPVEILPYWQIQRTVFKDGVFFLFSQGEAKPVLNKPTNSPNFFPGRFVVSRLLEISREEMGERRP